MKKYSLQILVFLFCFSAFAQVGYEPNVVIDDSYGMASPTETAIADIDNDGFADVIAAGNSKIAWFKNVNGEANFTNGKTVNNTFSGYHNVVAGDLDNDGDIDVAFSYRGNNVQVYYWCKNLDGQGNFGAPILLISGGSFLNNKMQIIDMDADNDMDIMISASTYLSFFENTNSLGAFTEHLVAGSHTSSSTSVANFIAKNVDSEPRAEFISVINGTLSCYKINPNYTVTIVDAITSSSYSDTYKVADIDNDGFQDIVTSYNNGNNKKLQWFRNLTGAGVFGTAQNMVTMPNIQSTNANGNDEKRAIEIVDFDNDNKLDVVHIDSNIANANWYKNMGNGTFTMQQLLITSNQNIRDVKVIDTNNDGFKDVLLTVRGENKIVWKNNNGLGVFGSENHITHICYNPNRVDYGDIDNDGDYDLVSSSGSDGKLAWYKNVDGIGNYTQPQQVIVQNLVSASNATLGDMDNDGDLDFVATSWYQNNGDFSTIVWYENSDGLGNFTTQHLVVSNTEQILKIRVIDIDNDNDLDIISASYNNLISLYKNNGNGTFASQVLFSTVTTNMYPLDLVVADIDNDNDNDVVVSFNNNEIAWYENNDGLGNLTTKHVIIPVMHYPISISVADIDGDNLKEVIFCNLYQNKIGYFKNLGSGNFDVQTLITVTGLLHPTISLAQDVDNDGDNDLIFDNNETSSKLFCLLNDGLANFSTPFDIYITANIRSLKLGDINADGKKDIVLCGSSNKIVWLKNLGLFQNKIIGNVKIDADNNGCDNQDNNVANALVTTQTGSTTLSTFTNSNGNYELYAGQGNYSTSMTSPEVNYNSNPSSYTSNFSTNNNSEIANFCLQPIQLFDDLNVVVYPLTSARPGFTSKYKILVKNMGTSVFTGDVTFNFNNSKINYLSSSIAVNSQTANSLNYAINNLLPFQTKEIEITFQVKTLPNVTIGENIQFNCNLSSIPSDINQTDNQFVLNQTIIAAYDPNDVVVLEGNQVLIDNSDQYLHYIIRFQNTGNSYAQRVRISNILDAKLDWNSIQLESYSHNNKVEIVNGNEINFVFDAIYLPSSNEDFSGSQGYISYKIKPKNNVVVGDIVSNNASIYFDYNPAINTNTVQTQFVDFLSNSNNLFNNNSVTVTPNPVKDWLSINTNELYFKVEIYSAIGQLIYESKNQNKIDLNHLNSGVYFVKITNNNNQSISKKILKL